MDTMRKIRLCSKNRGAISILVAGVMLTFLLLFLVLGVNFVYVYYVRGELQNAADSAALAGAALLSETDPSTYQINVRTEAWQFACLNKAAHDGVFLISDFGRDHKNPDCGDQNLPTAGLNDANDPDGDIVIGYWDGSFHEERPSGWDPNAIPNAVKAVARRASEPPVSGVKIGNNPVDLVFGNIKTNTSPSQSIWPTMGVKRIAIAARLLRASGFIALGTDSCNLPAGINILDSGPGEPYSNRFAWSSLLVNPTAPGFSLNDLVCSESPNDQVCNVPVYTTMGTAATDLKHFESVMYDPTFDADNKEIVGGVVTGWTITVPVVVNNPPGLQGNWDPTTVWGYADIHIIAICAPPHGGGHSCGGSPCRPYCAPSSVCNPFIGGGGATSQIIVIDSIVCTECKDINKKIGRKAVLVQ